MNKTERRLLKKIAKDLDGLLIGHQIEYGYTCHHGKGGYEYEQKFWKILQEITFLLKEE